MPSDAEQRLAITSQVAGIVTSNFILPAPDCLKTDLSRCCGGWRRGYSILPLEQAAPDD